MQQWLTKIYLSPQSQTYAFFTFLHRYCYLICVMIMAILLIYPIWHTFNKWNKNTHLHAQQESHQTRITQQQKWLDSFIETQQKENQKESKFTHINQKIKTLSEKYQAKIESIQWQLENGKQMNLVLTIPSQYTFSMLNGLNQFAEFSFNEILLLKLNQSKQIQLQAQFYLTQ